MNKKHLIVLGVIIAVVVALGVVGFLAKEKDTPNGNTSVPNVNIATNTNTVTNVTANVNSGGTIANCLASSDATSCLARLSLDTNDVTVCDEILKVPGFPAGTNFLRDRCVSQRLIESATSTPEQCDTLITSDATEKDLCINSLAVRDNKPELCKFDKCIGTIAVQTKNVSLCDTIKDASIRTWCTARVNEDTALCQSLGDSGFLKDDCLAYVGLVKKDKTICELTSNPSIYRAVCLGILNKNIVECKESAYCLTEVAMYLGDSTFCDQITVDSSALSSSGVDKLHCSALAKRDSTLCEKIDTTVFKSKKHDCRLDITLLQEKGVRNVRQSFLD